MNPTPPITPGTPQTRHEPTLPTAGNETGWWDEHGSPAPWPEDFWLADGTINPDWKTTNPNPEEEPAHDY